MHIPKDLKYSKSHEWIREKGNTVYVGITDYAQESLGDIVYVDIPELGTDIKKGDEAAAIESVKAETAIYAPVSGTIKEVNDDLIDEPELINEKPYGSFILAIEMSDLKELEELLDAATYEKFLEK